MSFKIHFLVPDPNGPVVSKPGGTSFKIGKDQRSVIACDPSKTLNEIDRGTGEPWQVVCAKCRETDIFKKLYYMKPGQVADIDIAEP